MTSAIDGLVSGLDTTSLIASLMQIEAAPQTLLKTKQSTAESLVSALQSLNTKVASLATTATTAAEASSWNAFAASSSSSAATAVADSAASEGSITFSVDRLATSQVSVTRAVADDGTLVPDLPPQLTVKKSDGTFVTIEPASGSLADVAQAINKAADAGIRATVVRVSSGGTAEYRIQFTGTTTGAENAFEVYAGGQAAVEAGTATRLDTEPVRTAQDALLTLWKGSGIEQQVTSASNTVADLMAGVDVTVTAVTGADEDPVTITVGRDGEALTALARDLVAGMGVVLSEIVSRTRSTTTTAADGGTVVTGGLLAGDSSVRMLKDSLTSAFSLPVDGDSPSSVGISMDRYGTFTFDEEAFAAALADDPERVQSLVSGMATRVEAVATAASDSMTGTLTAKITGQQSVVRDLGSQIDNWDTRLELRRTTLEKQYASLEVALSNMQAQQAWLTSQLESLTTSTSS